ncbi:MAG TPA: tetraacyldisaccharide 4'-kinase [Chromatiaceae bacterium]|jgi:tetraacyldisaccharide 4'-kinase|nr:MAG: tetraacyldisaccharide 4'-kinase [Thiohalocapsa sp. PB-PSB1]HBG94374.1 tetraacyldisaccharide 4'-kinase [Chromatiaceae bacterium]HCS89556.1 tetraacyldisaccharide 4'-kinase [Chromatiaceae bacterium]
MLERLRPESVWYAESPIMRRISALLAPLGWLYCGLSSLRAQAYGYALLRTESPGVPVIVVGNLTVGGTGKTPLAIWLVEHLRHRGLRPGLATRGYGGKHNGVHLVSPDADPSCYGDEPVLLAKRAGCPVVVGRDRAAAAQLLANAQGCDLIVTDDGLQHYPLRRDIEILVVDGTRGFGNGRCLPAGPLREPLTRASRVDLTIVNLGSNAEHAQWATDAAMCMLLLPGDAVNLQDERQSRALSGFRDQSITAVAGIGNPSRFFAMLRQHGLHIIERAFPDHYRFSAKDLARLSQGPVLMTEKDAVKCRIWASKEHWYVPVRAQPDAAFILALDSILETRLARAQRL